MYGNNSETARFQEIFGDNFWAVSIRFSVNFIFSPIMALFLRAYYMGVSMTSSIGRTDESTHKSKNGQDLIQIYQIYRHFQFLIEWQTDKPSALRLFAPNADGRMDNLHLYLHIQKKLCHLKFSPFYPEIGKTVKKSQKRVHVFVHMSSFHTI